MLAIALLFFSHHQSSEQFDFLYSSRAISGNMDVAPFKLDIDELIADYAKVNFAISFLCVRYMLTWMSYIVAFLLVGEQHITG